MKRSQPPPQVMGNCLKLDANTIARVNAFMDKAVHAFAIANASILESLGHPGDDPRDRKNSQDFDQSLMDGGDRIKSWSARPYTEPNWSIMRKLQHHPTPMVWVDVTLNDGTRDYPICYALAPGADGEFRSCYYIDRKKEKKSATKRSALGEPDFSRFKQDLTTAVSDHYAALTRDLDGERCVGYCLYTSDDVSRIGPVANRASFLKAQEEAEEGLVYYKYCADEWSTWDDFGLFESVDRCVIEHSKRKDYSRSIAPKLLQLCIDVLEALQSSGVFGKKSEMPFLAVWISDSDSPVLLESVKRLNSKSVYHEFESEFGDTE